MDPKDAREFLTQHHRGVLSTTRKDGRPQLSPVTATVDADGRVIISTRTGAVKTLSTKRFARGLAIMPAAKGMKASGTRK